MFFNKLFNKKLEIGKAKEKSTEIYKHPDVKKVMQENAEQVDLKDIVALTIAGLQVVAPRVILFIFSYLLVVGLFLVWFVN